MTFVVLDPCQEPVVEELTLAPRLSTLDGRVVGLYSNEKLNARQLLTLIGAELQERYDLAGIVEGTYVVSRAMEPGEWRDIDSCDAIVLAVGDCGSCSSSGIANSIQLEQAGIPSMLISTTPFAGVCATMAKLGGLPELRWATVDHPVGIMTGTELAQRARSAARQFQETVLDGAARSAGTEVR